MNLLQFIFLSFGVAMTAFCATPLICQTVFTYGLTMRCLAELTNEIHQLVGMWLIIAVLCFLFREK